MYDCMLDVYEYSDDGGKITIAVKVNIDFGACYKCQIEIQ